ncbi:hypothetical protein RJ639_014611 [Escallonia herrerae]|uniref:Uncharacterized protein n=1 Tax=Escallonia herrerae TaxID=1293975 RepID=A0AA88VFZ6_9ASTE|nr:hypothetical protein RJ639_014611 [Escallonia herrerae]
MACKVKILYLAFLVLLALEWPEYVCGEPQVPCYFIFGDSLVDNGNNNALNTLNKANFSPYGIDFVDGPTGRFTNGRNIADIIAELLGFDDYIPPYATARGPDILKGVNYGSGSAGIRDETGQQGGDRISMKAQLQNHRVTVARITALLGSRRLANEYLNKCLYTVGMGNNDYINNYFMPQYYPSSKLYTPDQYAADLILRYSLQLEILYRSGARKVGVFGVGDIGCTPFELASHGTNGSSSPCVMMIDDAVKLFNTRLPKMLDDLNNKLANAKFIFVNETSSEDSSSLGFKVVNAPCCKANTQSNKGLCVPDLHPCSNRTEFVYWDGFHPTETANELLAAAAYVALSPLLSSRIDTWEQKDRDSYISSI